MTETAEPPELLRVTCAARGHDCRHEKTASSKRSRQPSELRREPFADRLLVAPYCGRPTWRRKSAKRGSPRIGSSRGSTPTEGIPSERSRYALSRKAKAFSLSWSIACWRFWSEEAEREASVPLGAKRPNQSCRGTSGLARVARCCPVNLEYLSAKCLRVEATSSLSPQRRGSFTFSRHSGLGDRCCAG